MPPNLPQYGISYLSFVNEETAHLYSRKYGRPPIDPVTLVKYLLVGFLYGIPSERQIKQRIQMDVALRWYLGLNLFERVPDHSTISQLLQRKSAFRKVFRRLFEEAVRQRSGKPKGFHYLSHQPTDPDYGIITAVTVTPGDVHDSRPCLEQLEYVHQNVVPVQAATADSAYDCPLAHRGTGGTGGTAFL